MQQRVLNNRMVHGENNKTFMLLSMKVVRENIHVSGIRFCYLNYQFLTQKKPVFSLICLYKYFKFFARTPIFPKSTFFVYLCQTCN